MGLKKILHELLDDMNKHSKKQYKMPAIYIPKYDTDRSWIQDSNKSIIKNGFYDLNNFSEHERDTIIHVLNVVKNKYPKKYYSIGLANESYPIKYKARYVLFEIIILLYKDSDNAIDRFAVALAYADKGAYFRKESLAYFESISNEINANFMRNFISYMPLHVYTLFANLYEKEHEYEKAIYYTNIAKKYSEADSTNFDKHIDSLREKQLKNPKKRTRKKTEQQIAFENDVTKAAEHYVNYFI